MRQADIAEELRGHDEDDTALVARINELTAEMHRQERLPRKERTESVDALQIELDRLWDLRRRRVAEREAGVPVETEERPAEVVESYLQ